MSYLKFVVSSINCKSKLTATVSLKVLFAVVIKDDYSWLAHTPSWLFVSGEPGNALIIILDGK